MNPKYEKQELTYRPILFIFSVSAVTWCCAFLMGVTDYKTHRILFTLWDFLENASLLLCTLFLLRKYLPVKHFLPRFFLGNPCGITSYIIVFLLFAAQFLNFYLFRIQETAFSLQEFLPVFIGQLLLGGGLEEGGWSEQFPILAKEAPSEDKKQSTNGFLWLGLGVLAVLILYFATNGF